MVGVKVLRYVQYDKEVLRYGVLHFVQYDIEVLRYAQDDMPQR